jgi:hypothetical protein
MLELCCLAMVAWWTALRFRRAAAGTRGPLALQMLVIVVAAWIAEDSCIRLYGIYGYSTSAWRIFIDRVPLLVLLIWPVVVTSALDMTATMRIENARWPAALFLLVVADAWFIEPIAVDAGLWTWTEPGPFAVPTIGVLGWGCFAAGVAVTVARGLPVVVAVVTGPLVCHAFVLALWWGVFRWLPDGAHPLLHPTAAWVLAVVIVVVVRRVRPRGLRGLVWLRAPAAAFFFSLLAWHGRDGGDEPLVLWSLAFAPPWLALLVWSSSSAPLPPTLIEERSVASSSSAPLSPEARS